MRSKIYYVKPTAAERKRNDRVANLGCIACRMIERNMLAEVHHLNRGGMAGQKRRGHAFTIGLCAWHHRGDPMWFRSALLAEDALGPSLARSSKRFREQFGDDDTLLRMQNELLDYHGHTSD